MTQFLMAIDAGGTKTEGLLKAINSTQTWKAASGPGSLTNDLTVACDNIKQVVDSLLSQGNCLPDEIKCVCGAAGVGNAALKKSLTEILNIGFEKLLITTDARISLYGAGLGEAVVVVALGTGSVAMRLDKAGKEKQFGGWGFSVGDFGSGAYMGRELISETLFHFDQDKTTRSHLMKQLLSEIGEDRVTILSWLKNVTPTKFAALTAMIFDYANSDLVAKKIIAKTVTHVEKLIFLARGDSGLPVILLGGLSDVIYPYLSGKVRTIISRPRGNALSGCLYLAEKL